MVKKRRRHTPAHNFRVAQEALEGSKTIGRLSSENEIHANLIPAWKRQLLADAPAFFHNHERPHQSLNHRTPAAENLVLRSEPARIRLDAPYFSLFVVW